MPSGPVLAVLLAYGVVLFIIGLGPPGSGSVAGYYLADKQLPSRVIALSNNATGGGFEAVAYSDLLQGGLMLLGLLAMPFVGLSAARGWDAVMTSLPPKIPHC